jgi:hypothetical protein
MGKAVTFADLSYREPVTAPPSPHGSWRCDVRVDVPVAVAVGRG